MHTQIIILLASLLLMLLAFHMYQMHKANRALRKFDQHHMELHAKLELGTTLIETAGPIIEQLTAENAGHEAQQITMQSRIDELVDEVELLEERTHSTIDDQLKRVMKELREGKATLDEASQEIIKLSDKLLKADRQNVSIQRAVSAQEQTIEKLTGELAATARELAENREAADQPIDDDIMAVVEATRNSHDG